MKRAFKILGIVVGVFVLVAVAAIAYFFARPLNTIEILSRSTLRRNGAEKRVVRTSAGDLTYFVAGTGPTMVLLHGTNHHAGGWAMVAKDLSRDHRLIIPDLPGHGDSEPSSGPLDYATLLAGVRAVLDAEEPQKPVIMVGNSLGGWLALLYAQENPQRVSKLVLVDSSGISFPDYKGPPLIPTTTAEAQKGWAAVFGPTVRPAASFVLKDMVRSAPGRPMTRLMTSKDFPKYLLDGKLRDLKVPVSLIWGEDDGVLPLEYGRRLAAELPNARIVTLPKCGHIPQAQCPEAFVRALRSSLNPTQPAARGTQSDANASR